MDPTDRISVKLHDDDLPARPSSYPCSPRSSPSEHGRKRREVAKDVQKTLSKSSMLVNFLPTGTILTFEMVIPSSNGDGSCSPVSSIMILVLLGICVASGFFFHCTNSFHGPDVKVYYGS